MLCIRVFRVLVFIVLLVLVFHSSTSSLIIITYVSNQLSTEITHLGFLENASIII